MEENHNMYLSKLKEFGLPEPTLPQKKTMKRGGIKRYAVTGIVKPTATDAAGFEKWYNETLGSLIGAKKPKAEIDAFIQKAKQWAYDAKIDENQLQGTAGSYTRGPEYDPAFMAIQKAWEDEIDLAEAQNKFTRGVDANGKPTLIIDPATQSAIDLKRNKAIADLDKKYSNISGDYFYSLPGNPPNSPTTPGTTTTTTGTGGYQFNPAMQKMLELMAQGYTKAPLFGFRTNRNINALFNQTMADMMLKGQGQGQGTASATGTTLPGAPAVGPDGTYNTWIKDNNINRFDVIPGRNGVKMKIRANQPGKDIVQYDAKGNIVNGDPNDPKKFDPFRTRNFDPYPRGTKPASPYDETEFTRMTSQFDPRGYSGKSFLEGARNRWATNKLQRFGEKMDREAQKQQYFDDRGKGSISGWERRRSDGKGIFDIEKRYENVAERFARDPYAPPLTPEQLKEKQDNQQSGGSYAYGGAYSAGGQYKEGGTYYLSDEEIQALIDAGYELE